MASNKLNEREFYIICESVYQATKESIAEILEAERSGKRCLFSPNFVIQESLNAIYKVYWRGAGRTVQKQITWEQIEDKFHNLNQE